MKEKMSLEEATMKALLGELDDSKEDVEGIVDGVLVITDPEITPDDYTEVIDRANEIIEDTPEGEVPFNEEYVGEYIMTCPICGSSFANKEILNIGDACPVCMQVPAEGFVLNGQIATQEDVELQNDIKEDEVNEEELEDNLVEPISEEDVEEATEEVLASEEPRTADNKLEESTEYKSKYDELDDLLNLFAVADPHKMELYNVFNNNTMQEFDDEEYDKWLEDMKNEHFDELFAYLKERSDELDYYIGKLNETKEIKLEGNKYKELRDKHQTEFNEFPIKFAFSDEQFKKAMEELGLTEDDTDKIVSIGASGFIRKSDVEKFNEMNKRHRQEEKEAIDADTTGDGYIKDMFNYELANHEYGYTYDLTDTLEALGLTEDDINKDERLKRGLASALKRYKELDEAKIKYVQRPEQLNESKTSNLKLSESDIDYLKEIGYEDKDIPQIEEALNVTIYTVVDADKDENGSTIIPDKEDDVEITAEEARQILGDNTFLSGLSRSAFHWTSGRWNSDESKYVSFNSSKLFESEEKLEENLISVSELPDMCYGVLPSDASIIIIKKGEKGYYKTNKGYEQEYANITDWNERNDKADEVANRLNAQIGITPEQRMSMELRSMNGNWEDKEIKTEELLKESLDYEDKLKAIYDDYKNQGMESAYWIDLLNFIDDFDRLDQWYESSYPLVEEEVDDEWNELEESQCLKTESDEKEYNLVEADKAKIKELENGSAFTWEGIRISDEDLKAITEYFKENTPSIKLPITFYTWKGKLFNDMYGLTGTNAYPEDLNFLSIALDQWSKMGNLPMIKIAVGARWLDDIVDNNARRENLNESCTNKLFEVVPKVKDEDIPKKEDKEEEYSFEDIVDKMEMAETYEDLYEAATLIQDNRLKEEVDNMLVECEEDGDDADVAYSIVTSDLLDPLVLNGDKNV